MALTPVPLLLDLYDGAANLIVAGTATLAPSVQLTDTTDGGDVTQSGPVAVFRPSTSPPLVQILPSDNGDLAPTGWAWGISFSGVPGDPASYYFKITSSGYLYSFTATDGSPAIFTASGSSLANGTPVVLSGSSLPAGFRLNTIYYVAGASTDTFSLAAASLT